MDILKKIVGIVLLTVIAIVPIGYAICSSPYHFHLFIEGCTSLVLVICLVLMVVIIHRLWKLVRDKINR